MMTATRPTWRQALHAAPWTRTAHGTYTHPNGRMVRHSGDDGFVRFDADGTRISPRLRVESWAEIVDWVLTSTTFTITRQELDSRFGSRWFYSWTADDDSHMRVVDGRLCYWGSYGPGLASLKAMLRNKFGRGIRIVQDWD